MEVSRQKGKGMLPDYPSYRHGSRNVAHEMDQLDARCLILSSPSTFNVVTATKGRRWDVSVSSPSSELKSCPADLLTMLVRRRIS